MRMDYLDGRVKEVPSTRRWNKRYKEILSAGEAVFADKGYGSTRLDDIADLVDLRRASLDYYFKDKEVLYDAVMADIYGELLNLFRDLRHIGNEDARLEACVAAWLAFLCRRPSAARIFLRESVDALILQRLASTPVMLELMKELIFVFPFLSDSEPNPEDVVRYALAVAGATLLAVAARPHVSGAPVQLYQVVGDLDLLKKNLLAFVRQLRHELAPGTSRL